MTERMKRQLRITKGAKGWLVVERLPGDAADTVRSGYLPTKREAEQVKRQRIAEDRQ